jgi:hypothetical protein
MTALYRDYFLAKRDLENQQKIRDAILLRQLQETVDLQIPRSAIVEITDQAEPSLRPVRPNIPLNIALGVIVGLVVGIGLAFFIEYLDTSVKTIDDVERALGAPVLGVIPQNVGSLIEEGSGEPARRGLPGLADEHDVLAKRTMRTPSRWSAAVRARGNRPPSSTLRRFLPERSARAAGRLGPAPAEPAQDPEGLELRWA